MKLPLIGDGVVEFRDRDHHLAVGHGFLFLKIGVVLLEFVELSLEELLELGLEVLLSIILLLDQPGIVALKLAGLVCSLADCFLKRDIFLLEFANVSFDPLGVIDRGLGVRRAWR